MTKSRQVEDAAIIATRPPRSPVMHLKTSSRWFAIWWTVLLLLHAVNASYFVGAAMLYRFIRFTNVDFQLTTYSIGISSPEYLKVSAIHWIIAALHVLFIVAMVIGSMQMRQFVFQPHLAPYFKPVWTEFRSLSSRVSPQVA